MILFIFSTFFSEKFLKRLFEILSCTLESTFETTEMN